MQYTTVLCCILYRSVCFSINIDLSMDVMTKQHNILSYCIYIYIGIKKLVGNLVRSSTLCNIHACVFSCSEWLLCCTPLGAHCLCIFRYRLRQNSVNKHQITANSMHINWQMQNDCGSIHQLIYEIHNTQTIAHDIPNYLEWHKNSSLILQIHLK